MNTEPLNDPDEQVAALLAACDDAGIDPRDIDGFASYANDRNDATRLATALGIRELRFANMVWGGGGAGGAAAVGRRRMVCRDQARQGASRVDTHL